jgi:hypothetical protein
MYEKASLLGIGVSVMVSLAVNQYIENDNTYYPTNEELRQIKMAEIKPKN